MYTVQYSRLQQYVPYFTLLVRYGFTAMRRGGRRPRASTIHTHCTLNILAVIGLSCCAPTLVTLGHWLLHTPREV